MLVGCSWEELVLGQKYFLSLPARRDFVIAFYLNEVPVILKDGCQLEIVLGIEAMPPS